jgi:hypothetical protein
MNESKLEVRLTVQKLILLSLTEVFKDILPSYQIKHHEDPTVKRKFTVYKFNIHFFASTTNVDQSLI